MINDKFLKLTNTVYKILDLFPESDPLKNRAKDRALSILDNLVLINETSGWTSFQNEKTKVQILEDIDILLGYFWIAKSQGWMSSVNFLIVTSEYENIKKEIGPAMQIEPVRKTPVVEEKITPMPEKASVKISDAPMSSRQKQIIDFLNKNEKAQVMDLLAVLPSVTKRTIRRDLDELLSLGKIVRMGEFNKIFYKICKRSVLVS